MSIHQPASRLLVIGLDGGTWDVLGPLCDLGEMPNLARLRGKGAWSNLLSTQPPFTAPAWATFATGVNPGRHGVLNFVRKPSEPRQSLRGEGVPVNSTHVQAPTLFQYLAASGRTVGCMNLPLSYPLRPFEQATRVGGSEEGGVRQPSRSFAISGMLTPPDADGWVFPPELAEGLRDYVVELDYGRPGIALNPADLPAPAEMLADIARMSERRGFHALRLMQERPWDAFMVVFTGTDRIFHHFWHYLQADRADSASRLDITLSEKLQAYFRLLDSIIGGLVRSAGSDTTIVFVSDHGFGPAARQWVHLNNWLLDIDLLRLGGGGGRGFVQALKRRAPWLRDAAKRILPAEAREAVKQRGHLADAIDWEHTQAWAEPLYNNVAGIFLHDAERFRGGAVSPAAAEPLLRRLIRHAQRLTIPGSDRPLVLEVRRRGELYSGPHTASFPDLILTLDPDFAAVPTLGSSLITPIPSLLRSGDHRPEGIFLAYGPNVRPGQIDEPPGLIDIAPTLLHFADAPIPAGMEGRVISEAFNRGYLVLHPPRFGPDLPPPAAPAGLSAAERAAVSDRLRGLGYLQ